MKKIIFSGLILICGFLHLQAQIYTPVGTIQGTSGNSSVGIGTATPSAKLNIEGDHGSSRFLIHANGNGNPDPYHADLTLWASEPGLTWSGVGIGNNIHNYKTAVGGLTLLNTARGGSYIRLLDNSMLFNVVSISGVDRQAVSIDGNGNVGIGTTNPTTSLEIYKNLLTSSLKISNSDPATYNTELRLGGNNTFEKSAIISAPNPAGWWRQDLYFCLANGNNNNSATISDAAMVIKSYNSGQFGYVGIGSANPDQKLTVKGKIHAEEIIVDLSIPADYVFQKYYTGNSTLKSDYVMPTLAEIESFTKKNHHLPNVPSAQEVQQKGMSLGEMSNVLLQKVEELTLYAIEQNKEIERLKKENEQYKSLAERLVTLENLLKK